MVAPVVGDWLEATTGTIVNPIYENNGGVVARAVWVWQWFRGATPIAGATDFRYQVQAADVGETIHVETTPMDHRYRLTNNVVSDPTDPVGA